MESEQDVIVDWMHCWWYWLLLFISINLSKLVMSVETLQKAISNVISQLELQSSWIIEWK